MKISELQELTLRSKNAKHEKKQLVVLLQKTILSISKNTSDNPAFDKDKEV